MKTFSKFASIVLALVMMLTVCVMPTSAASDTEADIKFTVSKNADQSDDSYDVYDVTISVKAGANSIAMLNIPIIYDLTLFTPSSMRSNGTIKYTTAMAGLYKLPAMTKLGEFATEDYTFLEDGVTQDPECEGPVMPASMATIESSVGLESNLGSLDQSKYGCVYFKFAFAADTRYIVAKEEVAIATFHFFTDAGTDVSGAEFGTIGDSTLPAGTFETTGDTYYSGSDYVFADIAKVNVSNAVIKAASPVVAKTSQIRYNSAETNGKGSANFDVRTRAAMTAADFAKYCTYNAETKETNITKVGFVYADSSVGLTLDNAAKVIGGTAVAGYVDVPVEHIQLKDGEYIWTCLITDAAYDDAVDSVGYIVAGGKTFYFDAVSATDFSELYDTWSSKIPA